jgi:hypothetical protein
VRGADRPSPIRARSGRAQHCVILKRGSRRNIAPETRDKGALDSRVVAAPLGAGKRGALLPAKEQHSEVCPQGYPTVFLKTEVCPQQAPKPAGVVCPQNSAPSRREPTAVAVDLGLKNGGLSPEKLSPRSAHGA